MVELILSQAQLACAAVTIGSEESAALGRGVRSGNKVLSPELVRRQVYTSDREPIAHRGQAALPRRSCRRSALRFERDRTTEAT